MKTELWIFGYCLIGFLFLLLLPIVFRSASTLTSEQFLGMSYIWPVVIVVGCFYVLLNSYERYCKACKHMVLPRSEETKEQILRPVDRVN
jgi:hypothetical protein